MANNASAFATKVAFVRLSTKSPFVPQTLPQTFAAFTTERTARRVTLWDNLKWKEAQVVELETGGPLKTGEGLPLRGKSFTKRCTAEGIEPTSLACATMHASATLKR